MTDRQWNRGHAQSVLRPEDTNARLGGDEFAILVEDVRLPDETLALAERVLGAFEAPFELAGRPDGRMVGVEALARWQHPARGSVPPLVFIPCAEDSGLIVALGRWVLRRACADVANLRRTHGGARELRLSVNVSPRQLSDADFVGDVLGALDDAGLPTHALDLEVTESVVLDCGEEGIDRLRILRAAGVGIALDDFGTGYSSLGNLRTLPIDQLKVDRTFVSAMLRGGVDSAVVEAVVRLGAALGVSVVVEGIEDAAVSERLAQLGCPLGQGFLFGRPRPVAELFAQFPAPLIAA